MQRQPRAGRRGKGQQAKAQAASAASQINVAHSPPTQQGLEQISGVGQQESGLQGQGQSYKSKELLGSTGQQGGAEEPDMQAGEVHSEAEGGHEEQWQTAGKGSRVKRKGSQAAPLQQSIGGGAQLPPTSRRNSKAPLPPVPSPGLAPCSPMLALLPPATLSPHPKSPGTSISSSLLIAPTPCRPFAPSSTTTATAGPQTPHLHSQGQGRFPTPTAATAIPVRVTEGKPALRNARRQG